MSTKIDDTECPLRAAPLGLPGHARGARRREAHSCETRFSVFEEVSFGLREALDCAELWTAPSTAQLEMPAYMTFVNDLTSLCVGERKSRPLALHAPSSPAPRQLERPPLPSAKIHETRAAMWRKRSPIASSRRFSSPSAAPTWCAYRCPRQPCGRRVGAEGPADEQGHPAAAKAKVTEGTADTFIVMDLRSNIPAI